MSWKTALVTGASSGIGRRLAERLAERGTLVVLCARREGVLREVAEGIERGGGRARAVTLDVGDTSRVVEVVRALDEELSGFDLIVANAGVGVRAGASAFAWESLAGPCHVNFCGAVATLTAVLPRMVERGRGHLVGISSLASFGPLPEAAAYCAPKSGLSMLLECLRLDLRGTGVDVTAIHPGFVRTAMTENSDFHMPMLMDVDPAVDLIMRQLPKKPAAIDFPLPMAVAARLGAQLPRRVRELTLKLRKSSV